MSNFKKDNLTQQYILDLYKEGVSIEIDVVIKMWCNADLTWEQAMYGIIILLLERNKVLTADLVKMIEFHPQPIVIVADSEQRKQLVEQMQKLPYRDMKLKPDPYGCNPGKQFGNNQE